jgi:DNA-binding ferritin-like protein
MAFADKFRALHWAARSMSYHKALDDFYDEIEKYKDEIAENIQSIIGQFTGKEFTKLELPIDDNPLSIINELKICVTNWLNLHKDEDEYIGCESLTTAFLAVVHKYVYLFRLCKNNEI